MRLQHSPNFPDIAQEKPEPVIDYFIPPYYLVPRACACVSAGLQAMAIIEVLSVHVEQAQAKAKENEITK